MTEVVEVVDVPAELTTAVAGPRRPRSGTAPVQRAVQPDDPGDEPEDDLQPTVSFSVKGTGAWVESSAVAALVRNSLAHEALLHDLAGRLRVDVDSLLALLRRSVERDGESFTDAEAEALRDAHVDLSGPGVEHAAVSLSSRSAAQALLDDALSVEQAAALLGVSRGRVRQRLASGQLRGVRHPDGHTVIPRWQFRDGKVVPGLEVAVAEAATVHPLVLAAFMTTRSADLALGDDPATPLEWLATGGDPAVVAELLLAASLRG